MTSGVDLVGKRALLVGVGGIGRSIAAQLIEAGADLAMTVRGDRSRVDDLVAMADQRGRKAVVITADFLNDEDIEATIDEATSALGGIDVLIMTIGTTYELTPILESDIELIDRQLALELRSVILCMKKALAGMVEQRQGRIVIVASDSGKAGMAGEAVSAACRGGVIAFAKSAAQEYGRYGVVVNVVCPGAINTSLWTTIQSANEMSRKLTGSLLSRVPLKRIGEPDEVANAVLFLASDAASYITGQALSVNGGAVMQ